MTVSLMTMLGGRVNLTAAPVEKEVAVQAELPSDAADTDFETAMASVEPKEISARQLQEFFAAHGVDVDMAEYGFAGLEFTALNAQAAVMMQAKAPQPKLPSDVAVGVQEVQASQPVAKLDKDSQAVLDALIAQLPERELTADELSTIVQATGIEPIVIFDALRNTPAASPNLAAAMVDDMGAAAQDAGLPLPKPNAKADAAANAAVTAANIAAAVSDEPVADVPTEMAPKNPNITPEQQATLQKIVDALQGVSEQPELPGEWLSRVAALAAAQPKQTTKVTLAENAAASVAQPATNDNGKRAAKGEAVEAAAANVSAKTPDVRAEAAPVESQPAPASDSTDSETVVATAKSDMTGRVVVNVTEQVVAKQPETSPVKFAAPAPQQPEPQLPATEQVNVHIRKIADSGDTTIKINLKPVELGAVDIKIETGADGHARVQVTAEKRDTLDMLQRDVRSLERALQDIGFKADNSSLSFDLRGDNPQQQAGQYGEEKQGSGKFSLDGGYAEEPENTVTNAYDVSRAYSLTLDRGVDISV